MATAVTSPAPAPQGHCSRCGKVWTLSERQGVCQWCGKTAFRQTNTTKPRRIKSRSNGRRRQVPSNGNGYHHLEGKWLTYYKVASRFSYKAKAEDREDLLHDIILTLAVAERNNGHKPFTEPAMCRVASVTVAHYWRAQYRLTNGLDCGSCSQAQRRKCQKDWLYGSCPKSVRIESLDRPITDDQGNLTDLGELIADDQAIDLDQWLDAKNWLAGCPQRLIGIARKRISGTALDDRDWSYLKRFRQREQKRLF